MKFWLFQTKLGATVVAMGIIAITTAAAFSLLQTIDYFELCKVQFEFEFSEPDQKLNSEVKANSFESFLLHVRKLDLSMVKQARLHAKVRSQSLI